MTPDFSLTKYIPQNGKSSQATSAVFGVGQILANEGTSTEQKIQSILQMLPSLWSLVGVDEAGNAAGEVSKNADAETNLKNSIKSTQEKNNNEINQLINKIEENTKVINNNIEKANKAQEEKEKAQNEIEKQTQTITNCKGILENSNATSAERSVAIEKLKAANTSITTYAANIETLFSTVNQSQEEVAEATDNNNNINGEIETVVAEGNQDIQNLNLDYLSQITTNQTTSLVAKTNKATSQAAGVLATELEAASEGSSLIPGVGSVASATAGIKAQQMRKVESSQGIASDTREKGADTVTTKLTADKTDIQTAFNMISDLSNIAIGSYNEGLGLSDNFYSYIEPVGSWVQQAVDIKEQPEALAEAITDAEAHFNQNDENVNPQNNNNNSGNNDSQNNQQYTFNFNPDELNRLIG